MSWLSKNLKLIKEFDPSLYERLQKSLTKEDSSLFFKSISARNGEPTIIYNDGIKEKYILSSFNPGLQGEKWAKNQKNGEVYIVFGLAFGYHLPFLDRFDVEKILIIEPSIEIFKLALENTDLEWLFKSEKYLLSIADEKKVLLKKINIIISESYGKKVELVGFPSYMKIFADQYFSLEKDINETLGYSIIKFNTLKRFGKLWTNNFFKNLNSALKSPKIIDLFNKFKDMPIIIISAGPSLAKNAHLLKDLKGRAVLLCVGTAYRVLKAHDIKPDFIISFDGGIANYRHFEGLDIKDIPLIFDPIIYPQIIEEYQGKLISANITNIFMSWLEKQMEFKIGNVLIGPSVSNAAFDLARKFGGNPIVFVGQDLAYTDGRSHAEGTVYEDFRHEDKGSLNEVIVEDIYGNSVMTTRNWKTFLRWFEHEIKRTKDKTIIDATEGGARIEGTEVMSLCQVKDQYCTKEYNIEETIKVFFNNSTKPDNHLIDKAKLALEKIHDEVIEFKDKSSRGLEILDELAGLYEADSHNHKKINSKLQKLDGIDQDLLSFHDGKVFLEVIFQPIVLAIVKSEESRAKPNETEKEMQTRIIKFSKKLYQGIRDISDIVLEMIADAKKDFD